jgi:hypothetical protein
MFGGWAILKLRNPQRGYPWLQTPAISDLYIITKPANRNNTKYTSKSNTESLLTVKTNNSFVAKKESPPFDLHEYLKSKITLDDKRRCVNAFQILSDPALLKLAYNAIKSKPGNMSLGVDKSTLDGIDDN